MTDSKNTKIIIGLTVFIAIAGVVLIVSAVASDHWISAQLISNSNATVNRTKEGVVNCGLFKGRADYDLGLSWRHKNLELKCDLSDSICGYMSTTADSKNEFDDSVKSYKNGTGDLEDYGLFGFALFATTLTMLTLSAVFGLLAIGFAVFNVFGRPIESITGIAGLYVWNAFALLFVLIGIGAYAGLFFTQLFDMIPNLPMLSAPGTIWENDTKFDWSFFCVVGTAGAFFINIVILLVSGKQCSCSYSKSGEKEVDNGIILY